MLKGVKTTLYGKGHRNNFILTLRCVNNYSLTRWMRPDDARIKAITLPATYPIVRLGLKECTITNYITFIYTQFKKYKKRESCVCLFKKECIINYLKNKSIIRK